MNKTSLALFVLLFFAISQAVPASADEFSDLKQQIKAMQEQISAMQKKIDALEAEKGITAAPTVSEIKHTPTKPEHVEYRPGEGIEIKPLDLSVRANATIIGQGVANANAGGNSAFGASWKADVEIEKRFWDWGLAYVELEAGQGDTVEDELNLFSNVNNNANDTGAGIEVNKFFYEQYLFNKQLTLTAGKLDATDYMDKSTYAGDDSIQFLGKIFNNSPVVEFPSDKAFGGNVNISLEPINFLDLDLGYYEADADWKDVFNHPFYSAELNVKTDRLLNLDPEQWEGNYRFYGWLNDRNHTKLVDAGEAVSTETKEVNYGFGLCCDQNITDVFGVFGRFGWQRPDIEPAEGGATLEWSWSAGGQMTGKYWMRERDIIGIAVGQIFPSEEYKDAGNPGSAEGHAELYYKWQLNGFFAISPGFQVIWNPNGVSKASDGNNDTIFVYGMRGHLDF